VNNWITFVVYQLHGHHLLVTKM